MIDPEEVAENLRASEARIDRQIRLLAELEWSGHMREARMARELLAAITEARDIRLALLRRHAGILAAWPPPVLPQRPAEPSPRRS